MAAGVAVVVPALVHGYALGPYDLLSYFGLTASAHPQVYNAASADQIQQFIPWLTAAWNQVHHGHLPLWNSYSVTGMPLAFNWQSAVFSPPVLISYLFPLRLAYTVTVIAKILIGGTGAYALARALKLSHLASVVAATAFELSGPFSAWLGWPHMSVMVWMGWVFAATVKVIREGSSMFAVVGLSLALAAAIYGGHPESILLLLCAELVFAAVLVVGNRLSSASIPMGRPSLRLVLGGVGGVGLAAPLLLPALQITGQSTRSDVGSYRPLPLRDLVHILVPHFDGLPVAGSAWFGAQGYYEAAAGLGAIVVALAVVAIVVRWRRVETGALMAVALLMGALAFCGPLATVVDAVPGGGTVLWNRALIPMAFAVAMLAGAGLEAILRSASRRTAIRMFVVLMAILACVVGALVVVSLGKSLPPADRHTRLQSFVWPSIEIGLGLVAGLLLWSRAKEWHGGRGRWLRSGGAALPGCVLLIGVTSFGIWMNAPLWSSSNQPFASSPSLAALLHTVGDATVGFGRCPSISGAPDLGVLTNANVAYGLHEMVVYDPMLPANYYREWERASGASNVDLATANGKFCPSITSAQLARTFGVPYVLEPANVAGPAGSVYVRRVGSESLFAIPGAGQATLSPVDVGGSSAAGAPSRVLQVVSLDASTLKIGYHSNGRSVLGLHLTDMPGWKATIDGKPLALRSWKSVMMQATVPSGRHVVELRYWPNTFTYGLIVALLSVVVFVMFAVAHLVRQRSRKKLVQ